MRGDEPLQLGDLAGVDRRHSLAKAGVLGGVVRRRAHRIGVSLITFVPVCSTGSLRSAPNSRPMTSPAPFCVRARTMSGVPGRPDSHTTSKGPVGTVVPRGTALDSTCIA